MLRKIKFFNGYKQRIKESTGDLVGFIDQDYFMVTVGFHTN